MANEDKDLDDDLDGLLIPWHWVDVEVIEHNVIFDEWCEKQRFEFGIDYYYVVTDKYPAYSSEWGRFKLGKQRAFHYLFKDSKNAILFRLRWSEYIA
jgi:hypothetical protein